MRLRALTRGRETEREREEEQLLHFITFCHLSRGASYTGLAIIAPAAPLSLIFACAMAGLLNVLTWKSCSEMHAFRAATAYEIATCPYRLRRIKCCSKLPEHRGRLI